MREGGIASGAGAALDRLNRLPPAEAERELRACCAAPGWARVLAEGRPYRDLAALLAAADAATAALTWPQVAQAVSAHPRIGERVDRAGPEAAWSRREQAGVAGADATTRAALAEANRAYEARFGHIFLIAAAGRSDQELLAAARRRLDHDEATERAVVQAELATIARLRLERLLG